MSIDISYHIFEFDKWCQQVLHIFEIKWSRGGKLFGRLLGFQLFETPCHGPWTSRRRRLWDLLGGRFELFFEVSYSHGFLDSKSFFIRNGFILSLAIVKVKGLVGCFGRWWTLGCRTFTQLIFHDISDRDLLFHDKRLKIRALKLYFSIFNIYDRKIFGSIWIDRFEWNHIKNFNHTDSHIFVNLSS